MRMISMRRGGFLQGWLTLLLILLVVVALSGWFVARTQGFRDLVARRLSAQLGVPVRIEHSYIGWPYVLVLRGVEAEDEALVLQVRTLRLGRRLRRWSINVRGARVTVTPSVLENHAYRYPVTFLRLASMREPGALDIMRVTAHLQSQWHLSLEDIDWYWQDEERNVVAAVRQLQFMMKPVQLPTRELIYYRLSYPGVAEKAFGGIRDLDWEWLSGGQDDYISIQRSGVMPTLEICEQ